MTNQYRNIYGALVLPLTSIRLVELDSIAHTKIVLLLRALSDKISLREQSASVFSIAFSIHSRTSGLLAAIAVITGEYPAASFTLKSAPL